MRRNGTQPAQQRSIHFNQECKDPLLSIFVKHLSLQLVPYLQTLAKQAGRELLMKTPITSVFVGSGSAKCANSCFFSTRLKNAKNPNDLSPLNLGLNTFQLHGNAGRSTELLKTIQGNQFIASSVGDCWNSAPFPSFCLPECHTDPAWFTWSYGVRSVQNNRCQQLWVLGVLSISFTLSNNSALSTTCSTAFISIKNAFFPQFFKDLAINNSNLFI